ncbi:hypothetical protein [Acinetobacter sp. ANC 3813]|uniref:hypothetical protein n=1 Tax=Acinetobacter sp. ANC 3813 TaxID=1977873 RepID=UPI000A3376EE|nr:hypothetical protein [Acinetobacter sp. ANC 3813]OTG87928.1 hypothetical protein B9T34_16475 [Acinetobacter sp. ANC 3813]
MQLIRSAKSAEGFKEACIKYEGFDARYVHTEDQQGVFKNDFIECAYIVYLLLQQAEDDSPLKKAFDIWREFYCEGSKNLSVFFRYVDHLFCDAVTGVWLFKWDSKDRKIAKEREMICRIFILSGITAIEKFYKSGALS